jgi:chromatin remodeling complex protein RSC6
LAKKKTKKAAKKAAKKVAKKAPKKAARKAGGTKRRGGGAAFMRPVTPDEALGAVVGAEPKPRTEIAKRLWAYIRSKGLQDKTNRRMINADDMLAKVFGGKRQVSMFEMTKLASKHLKS